MKIFFAFCITIILLSRVAEAKQKLQVVTEIFPPYQRYNELGKLDGWSTKIVLDILNHSKLPYEISVYPWPRTYHLATNQPGTIVYSLLRNQQREKQFHWIAPLCEVEIFLFRFKSKDDVIVDQFRDARAYVIGVGRDQPDRDYLLNQGFILGNNLVEVTSSEQLRMMMKRNRIDLIMASKQFIDTLNQSDPDRFEELVPVYSFKEFARQLFLAAHMDTPIETVNQLKNSYQEIKNRVNGYCKG